MRKFIYSTALVASIFFVFIAIIQKESPHEIALDLINSLSTSQRPRMLYNLQDSASKQWHYLPWNSFERPGIALKELSKKQKPYVFQLLQIFLSSKGYNKTKAIIELEDILAELEKNSIRRDKEKYYVSIYGTPSEAEPWRFHFQGHHVSLNFTVVGENIAFTPRFFGANPAKVPSGAKKGLRVLKEEEDLAFALVNKLDETQKQQAIFQSESFYDIQSTNLSDVSPTIPALASIEGKGLKLRAMNDEQQNLLFNIIEEYISAVPEEVANKRIAVIKQEEKEEIRFGWAGATQHGEGHYYFIMGKAFLIEFDNTQNNANHIHTVWRDFNGDWGQDLIREHYKNSDHHH